MTTIKKSDHKNSAKETETGTQKYIIHALVSKVNLFFILRPLKINFFLNCGLKTQGKRISTSIKIFGKIQALLRGTIQFLPAENYQKRPEIDVNAA